MPAARDHAALSPDRSGSTPRPRSLFHRGVAYGIACSLLLWLLIALLVVAAVEFGAWNGAR